MILEGIYTQTADFKSILIAWIKRLATFLVRRESLLVIGLLTVAAVAHSINMFHYPYFEDDEGTYLSQAWAVITEGRLAYYTYWYDHAPVGWFQIAFWMIVTGGFHTFGSPLYSGRIFMLVLQIASSLTVYGIAKRISGSMIVASMVVLLFALSPYGIYFHRRVLLDNLTTLPMLLSIFCLLGKRVTLKQVWLSALFFSIAVLSKEITAFLFPGLVCLVICQTDTSHRKLATAGWIVLVATFISFYPLMSLINNEFFPAHTFLGGNSDHVSLIQGVTFQASRTSDRGVLNPKSAFWIMARTWIEDDPLLVVGGFFAALLSLLFFKKRPLVAVMGLCSLCIWAYFMHGGEVIKFYLVPLLPLLALNLCLFLWAAFGELSQFIQKISKTKRNLQRIVQPVLLTVCIVAAVGILSLPSINLGYRSPDIGDAADPLLSWDGTQADAQVYAMNWIHAHIPTNSYMVIDMSMWPDLHDYGYDNAHYYWKVSSDPAIGTKIFHDRWQDCDYVIATPQMQIDARSQHMTLVLDAIQHSTLLTTFDTGGWPVQIYKVNKQS